MDRRAEMVPPDLPGGLAAMALAGAVVPRARLETQAEPVWLAQWVAVVARAERVLRVESAAMVAMGRRERAEPPAKMALVAPMVGMALLGRMVHAGKMARLGEMVQMVNPGLMGRVAKPEVQAEKVGQATVWGRMPI